MSVEGIDVVELNLSLPNAHYYLAWRPAGADDPQARRALLQSARASARALNWQVFASGGEAGALRLVFATTVNNLDRGLASLAGAGTRHRLYLVQAESALAGVARRVHEGRDPAAADDPGRPRIHYGLFIGEQAWADRMLDLLQRCAIPREPSGPACLSEVAGRFTSRREAVAEAYRTGRFSLKDIAEHFDMHFSEVSAVINSTSI